MALETLSVFLTQKAIKDMFWVGNKSSQASGVLWWKDSLGIISSRKGKESPRTLGYSVSLEESVPNERVLKCSLFPSQTTESQPFPLSSLCLARVGGQDGEMSDRCWALELRRSVTRDDALCPVGSS